MACYLIVSDVARECEGCGAAILAGLVGMTDEIDERLERLPCGRSLLTGTGNPPARRRRLVLHWLVDSEGNACAL